MLLRGYQPGDLDAMHALDVICFERPFCFTRSAMRRFAEARNARVTIAEVGQEFAGFVILHVERTESFCAGYIVTLDVAPERRRAGVARALMQAIEEQALADKCSLLALHVFAGNAQAIRFYEHIGFSPSHREPDFYGDGFDAVVYHKVIQQPHAPAADRDADS